MYLDNLPLEIRADLDIHDTSVSKFVVGRE